MSNFIEDNTLFLLEETPETVGDVTEDENENNEDSENPGTSETGGGEDSETGGDGSSEDTDIVPAPSESVPAPAVSGNDIPDVPPVPMQEVTEALGAVADRLEDIPDGDTFMESLQSLADAMSAQVGILESRSFYGVPIPGYKDYGYPVYVVYRIFPTALGSETGVSGTFDTPEAFESDYMEKQSAVAAGNLAYFYVGTVTDCNDETVYNAKTMEKPGIPLAGYENYSYPVDVVYRIFPTSLGSETGVSGTYATPEEFEDDFIRLDNSVTAGNLAYFSIRSVTDSTGGTVYDADASTEEPEEPGTFRDDVLTSLDRVNEGLATISMNDLDYREQSLALQEQCLALQQETVELHYHAVACDIAIGFALLLTLGYTVAHGFFQRMKVG